MPKRGKRRARRGIVSKHARTRVDEITRIIQESSGPISMAEVANRLGAMHSRTFSRQYISQMVGKHGIEFETPTLYTYGKSGVCPKCGESKKGSSKQCIRCHQRRWAVNRAHHHRCPICGNYKARHSNRCATCRDADRPVPAWFDRKKVPV